MTDYTFMKSGYDNLVSNEITEEQQNMISIIIGFTENAMKTSAKYTEHCKRDVVLPEDIVRSMMLEMFVFNKRENIVSQLEEIRKAIFEDESDDEEIILDEPEKIPEFCESSCDCMMCKTLNNIKASWETFTPSSRIETLLKKYIDKMANGDKN
jgi:histone H3/H4